jgi:S-adenosylmethionine:tRNA ribosyltransferase-isomerase
MRVDAFQYELPPDLIAQHPASEREHARLMVVRPDTGAPSHRRISDLPDVVDSGSLIVVNDTRVIPARLLSRKPSGGRVEWLLVRRIGSRQVEVKASERGTGEVWHALGKGIGPAAPGTTFDVALRGAPEQSDPALKVTLLGRSSDSALMEVLLWAPSGEPIGDLLEACGHVPLPPYIRRGDVATDSARYQTVYARNAGAIAAPTAGLHLTREIIRRLESKDCEVVGLTLHVGLGTFQPVQSLDLDDHPMHAEPFELPAPAADAVARARSRGSPVIAVGTTSARALESAADLERPGHVRAMTGETRLLIQPGHPWRVVDALLTNFHQPHSTLMALVCAFSGTERLLAAYRSAVQERYRFLSYGDAMFLWRAS